MKIRKILLVLAIGLCLPFALAAQEEFEMGLEEEIDEEFEWIREEAVVFTEIATRTKMDADLVPGMVMVMKGEDLKKHGARTVFEALSLIPGIHTARNSLGNPIVVVRGIGGSFFSGNLKLMLDDVVLNDTLSASGYAIYEIPVEQVDRLEIIRGPGSVIYGEYAYAGVLNVKTRKSGNKLYARCEGDGESAYSYGAGGSVGYEDAGNELSIRLNADGWKSGGPDVESGEDRLYSGFAGLQFPDYSYAPGATNEARDNQFADLLLKYKDFSLSGQFISQETGDYYGLLNVLPKPEDKVKILNKHISLEARHGLELPNSLKLDVKAGLRRYKFDLDELMALPPILNMTIMLPDGTVIPIGDITAPDGSIAGPHYEEEELYGGVEFIWEGLEKHTMLFGVKYSNLQQGDTWVDANSSPSMPGVLTRMEGDENWLSEDNERDIYSIYMQELFKVTENFTLTAGLRYDHYNNHEVKDYDNLTPRLSAVYRPAERHILKAQYSEAVRPPTFTELFSRGNSLIMGNGDLDPEHIRSYELGYIFRHVKFDCRATLFHSELEDNIQYPVYADQLGGEGIQYTNAEDTITTSGIELELKYPVVKEFLLGCNLSFSETEDEDGEPLDGAADWLGNVNLTYRPLDDYSLAMDYRYVGERHRTPDDPRDDLDAYDTVNLTANVYNLFKKGLSFGAGIKNLFDTDIVYPAPVYKDAEGNIGYSYQDDYPRQGREWWVQISYDF